MRHPFGHPNRERRLAGPIAYDSGLPTETQPSGGGQDAEYVHTQGVADDTWTINHNLDKFPSVTVVDSANTVVIGDIQYLNSNSLLLTFSAEFGGKAYLN